MAKLEGEGLPFAYRPLEPEPARWHLRRRKFLRAFFMLLIIFIIIIYVFLKWMPEEPIRGSKVEGFYRWWNPSKPTTQGFPGGGRRDPDAFAETVKQETLKKGKGPVFTTMPIKNSGKGGRKKNTINDGSLHSMISPYVDPKSVSLFARMMLEQLSELFLTSTIPMIDVLLPKKQLKQLELTLDALAKRRISIQEALENIFLSFLTTAGIILLTLFPNVGRVIIDHLTGLFKAIKVWLDTTDPKALLTWCTDSIAEWIIYLMGLSRHYVHQASSLISDFIVDLFRDSFETSPDIVDQDAWLSWLQSLQWLPSMDKMTTDGFELAKNLATLKAQETLSSTISSQLNSYMNPNDKKSPDEAPTNPLASMATQMLTSMLTNQGNNEGGEDGNEGNLLNTMMQSFLNPKNNQDADGESQPPRRRKNRRRF